MSGAEIVKYLRNPSLLSEESLSGVRKITMDYPWFYPGWVLYLRNLKNLGDPDYSVLLSGVALRVPDRRWLRDFLEKEPAPVSRGDVQSGNVYTIPDYQVGETLSEGETVMVSQGKQRLIDDFLAGGGSFNPLSNNEPAGEQIDLAEKAVSVSDGIFTETFAQLLVSQRKYGDAIQAFKKLSLRFPEKSIYFATRIEEITKLMNQ